MKLFRFLKDFAFPPYSLLDGGLSIDPDSWLKNPGASLEDMLKLKQQQNEEYR